MTNMTFIIIVEVLKAGYFRQILLRKKKNAASMLVSSDTWLENYERLVGALHDNLHDREVLFSVSLCPRHACCMMTFS
jgi:hypothetical protein